MTELVCDACGKPIPDQAHLCGACTYRLRKALGVLRATADELDVVLTRQAVIGDRAPRTSGTGETPLPFDTRASDLITWTRTMLQRWVSHIATTRGLPTPAGTALGAQATFIAEHTEWIRHRDDALAVLDDLTVAANAVTRVIDLPAETWFAGPCWAPIRDDAGRDTVCRHELYAKATSGVIACPACATTHDVGRRREWLLGEVDDVLAHAALIARALTGLGAYVYAGTVTKWASRGRLVNHGHDPKGRPLYRIGDVLDLLRDDIHARTTTPKPRPRRTA